MGALATLQAAIFDIAHLVRVPTREHLRHQALIVGRLVTRMDVLKRLPVIGEDLLEDIPVPRRLDQHRVAPSEGDQMVAVKRLYHDSLGLEVHGSLGIVLWAAAWKHLNREEAAAALDRLAHSSLWISARVLAEARAALDRLFA
jgi:hypothetical protein